MGGWMIEIIINFFEVAIIMFFMKKQFETSYKTRTKVDLMVVILGAAILTICNTVFEVGSLLTILVSLCFWIVAGIHLYGVREILKIVLSFATIMVVFIGSELIVIVLVGLVFNFTPMDIAATSLERFGVAFNSILLSFLFVKNYRQQKLQIRVGKPFKTFVLFLMFALNMLLVFFISDIYRSIAITPDTNHKVQFISLLMFACNILVIIVGNIIYEATQLEAGKQLSDLSLSLQSEQVMALKQVMEDMRRHQHDFKNHLQAMHVMVQHGKTEELERYLGAVCVSSLEIDQLVTSSMTAVELILFQKMEAAKRLGIQIEKDVHFPNNLESLEYSMAVIISNSMDNAIEACQWSKGDKSIKIRLFIKEAYLHYSIENSSDGYYVKDKERFITRKKEANLHGFGLGNIEVLVEKHHGFLDIQALENTFALRCSLMIEQVEK